MNRLDARNREKRGTPNPPAPHPTPPPATLHSKRRTEDAYATPESPIPPPLVNRKMVERNPLLGLRENGHS